MKAIAFPLVLALAGAGVAGAHEGATHKTSLTTGKKAAATRMEGEVVSTDPAAGSFVLKTDAGDQTLMVKGKIASRLKSLTAGERVKVEERDNEVISIHNLKGAK